MNEIPRRSKMQEWDPAEKAIWDAMQLIESRGADPILTEAVVLLGQAKDKVADFIDAQPRWLPPVNTMNCPRRVESAYGSNSAKEEFNDHYREGDGSCSYCGSLNPDVFMARLEAGDIELGPTDKNYKVYVKNIDGDLFKSTHRDDNIPFAGYGNPIHNWVTREITQTKFYFQHLSDEQKTRFVEILNEGKILIGMPGHFYTPPYFTKPVPNVEKV